MATTIATEKATWAMRMTRFRRALAGGWSVGVAVIRTPRGQAQPPAGTLLQRLLQPLGGCRCRLVDGQVHGPPNRAAQPDPTTLLAGRCVVKAAEYAAGPPAMRCPRLGPRVAPGPEHLIGQADP